MDLVPSPTRADVSADASGPVEGSSGRIGPWRFAEAEVGRVADAALNRTVGAWLLVAAGVPPTLAQWIVTTRPHAVVPQANGPVIGPTAPQEVPKDAATSDGGFRGYGVRGDDGALLSAAAIRGRVKDGALTMGVDRAWFETHVRPLLDNPEMVMLAGVELQVSALQQTYDAEVASLGYELPDDLWKVRGNLKLAQLSSEIARWSELARGLRTGEVNAARLLDQQVRVTTKLEQALVSADAELRTANDKIARAPTGEFGEVLVSSDERRNVAELEAWRDALQRQLDGLRARPDTVWFPDALGEVEQAVDGGRRFTSTLAATGYAARAGLTEGWATIGRIDAGLADGGAFVAGWLGWDQTRELLDTFSRRAYGKIASLERDAGQDTALAEPVLGRFGTEVVKLLTVTAVLALPTLGTGVAGAAVGGAVRGTAMAARVGAGAGMATFGALSNSGRGAGAMTFGALSMGLMPLFGSVGSTGGQRLLAAFLGNAVLDGLGSVDVSGAYKVLSEGGTAQEAARVAIASVSVERMLANGLVGVLTEAVLPAERPQLYVDRTGRAPRYFRLDGEALVEVPRVGTAEAQAAVPLSAAEVDAIGRGTTQVLDGAAARQQTIDALTRSKADTEAALAKATDPAEKAALVQQRDADAARLRVLDAAARGEPLSDAAVVAAGFAPDGYSRSASGEWTWREGVAREALTRRLERTAKARAEAKGYRELLDQIAAAEKRLFTERKRTGTNRDPVRIDALRRQLVELGEQAGVKRAALEAVVTDGGGFVPEGTVVEVDPGEVVRSNLRGDVFEPVIGGSRVTLQLGDADAILSSIVPTKYGGVGRGQGVDVALGTTRTRGVLLPTVEGTALPSAKNATYDQFQAYHRQTRAAIDDGVILTQFEADNVVLGDRTVRFRDSVLVTRESFEATLKKLSGDLPPAKVEAEWASARERFEAKVTEHRKRLESLLLQEQAQPLGTKAATAEQLQWDRKETERIAKDGESWGNNKDEGTCLSVAMRNAIAAQRAGLQAYVLHFDGVVGGEKVAHAVTAIVQADGSMLYVSWGRVERDWQTFAKEVFGDTATPSGTWFTVRDHVDMTQKRGWSYDLP